ncbi:hypothetical protein DIPPA_30642 [Diplonema papillatum]|nr:hypothetical protein DIPPA_30642 [Diplonema papillatum]
MHSRAEGARSTAVPKKTGFYLQHVEATIAYRRVQTMVEHRVLVRCAGDAAMLTDGALLALCGETLVVAWNTAKPCRMHFLGGIHFASELKQRCDTKVVRVGLAVGTVHHGNLGTSAKRFNTVMGRTVNVATVAASLTVQYHTFCVAIDCTGGMSPLPRGNVNVFLRLLDVWLETSTQTHFVVQQLLTSKLRDVDDLWGSSDDTVSQQHYACLTAAIAGSRAELEKLRQEGESNPTLKVCFFLRA